MCIVFIIIAKLSKMNHMNGKYFSNTSHFIEKIHILTFCEPFQFTLENSFNLIDINNKNLFPTTNELYKYE